MADPSSRRFTIGDALLLVAALAAGLAAERFVRGLALYPDELTQKVSPVRIVAEQAYVYGEPLLVPLTLLELALSFRRPSPNFRDVVGRPGFVACAAVLLAIVSVAFFFVDRLRHACSPAEVAVCWANSMGSLSTQAGQFIIGAWLALGLAGRWRPGPSWVDRLGCILGACWVVIHLTNKIYFLDLFRII